MSVRIQLTMNEEAGLQEDKTYSAHIQGC